MNTFKNISRPVFTIICVLFLLALASRLFFLFFVSGLEYCGWYHDSYHHWQIAYYTLHKGLRQSPPRMWDLNGMEYFWGLLPTLTESFLLWVFSTTSLVPFRIFNSIMGSFSVCLIYLLGKRYFSERIGLLAAILVAICPILWEVDTSGMLDPMGVTFLLLAVLFYGRNTLACGFFSGLASLCHIEFWFISLALCGCYLAFERSGTEFAPSILGWLAPMVPYFWFLQTRTGDWLYSFKWNYICSVKGEWIKGVQVPFQAQVLPRGVAVTFLALSVAAFFYLIKLKPRRYPVHAFFLAKIAMQGVIFGLTAYIVPYIAMHHIGRLFVDRLFALNYYYISILAVWGLEKFPARFSALSVKLCLKPPLPRVKQFMFLFVLIAYLLSFSYVSQQYFNYRGPYEHQMYLADYIVSHYEGGSVISSLVIVNYRLIDSKVVPCVRVFGSLYSPLYYGIRDITKSYEWLRELNATWVIVDQSILDNFQVGGINYLDRPPFHVIIESQLYYVNQTELDSILKAK